MIIVKLDQALIIRANWPKLCQHTDFKLLSQNHAPFKLAQACCKLKFFLCVGHSAFHFFSPPDISTKDVGIAGFAASANLVVLMKVQKNRGQ